MITRFTRIGLKAIIICALSCGILFANGCTKNAGRQDIPLNGTFAYGNWEIILDNNKGVGLFTKVGDTAHQVGDEFLKITERTAYDSWDGKVFDKDLHIQQEGTISLGADKLVITQKNGIAYTLFPPSSAGSGNSGNTSGGSSGSGSGCTSVQCHGTTKSGARCSRMTTNCSGYCWQH